MSRVLFVNLDQDQIVTKCLIEKVGISAIERLPQGGTRLVCMSTDGAERMNAKFKKHLIHAELVRAAHRPTSPLW